MNPVSEVVAFRTLTDKAAGPSRERERAREFAATARATAAAAVVLRDPALVSDQSVSA